MTAADVAMSTYSLRAYALGLMAFMAIKVLATGFYAQQDMKTPVRIGIIAMVSNMVLNLIFVLILHHYWQLGHVGLALATSLSAALNAWLLFRGLSVNKLLTDSSAGKGGLLTSDYWRLLLQVLLAVLAMVAVLVWLLPELSSWAAASWTARCYDLSMLCIAGLTTYLIALWVLGVRVQQFKSPEAG